MREKDPSGITKKDFYSEMALILENIEPLSKVETTVNVRTKAKKLLWAITDQTGSGYGVDGRAAHNSQHLQNLHHLKKKGSKDDIL